MVSDSKSKRRTILSEKTSSLSLIGLSVKDWTKLWRFLKVCFLDFRHFLIVYQATTLKRDRERSLWLCISRSKRIPGVGHLLSSFIPTPGNLPPKTKKVLMPGGKPGGGMGAAGIDWCISLHAACFTVQFRLFWYNCLAICRTGSRDQLYKQVVVQNGCQKWKKHDKISKDTNLETAVAYAWDFKNVWKFEKFKGFVWLGGKPCHQPYKSFKIFEFSGYHKISWLSNSSLQIGILTYFIMLFPFLTTILYYHLFLWLIWSDLVTWPCPAKSLFAWLLLAITYVPFQSCQAMEIWDIEISNESDMFF